MVVIPGTAAIQLGGPISGFSTFASKMNNGDTTCYRAAIGSLWEYGLGTWHTGDTLSRDIVFDSSNSGELVDFAGADVFVMMVQPPSPLTGEAISFGSINFPAGAVVASGTYVITGCAPFAGAISELASDLGTGGGSFDVEVRNNGTSVGGLSAVTVTTPGQTITAASGTNVSVAINAIVDVIVSNVVGSPTDSVLTVNGVHS